MKKEVFGQPLWLWAVGAVVVIGGYLYFRSHSASSSSGSGSGGGQGTPDTSTSSFKEWIKQHNGPPSSPPPKDGGPGPERQWLIHKTGSDRPWTWLAQHHERVEVGPTGSRKIVGQ